MLVMLAMEDMVSVGWQWASQTPMCQGKGSVASWWERSWPLAGWGPVGGHMSVVVRLVRVDDADKFDLTGEITESRWIVDLIWGSVNHQLS